MDPKAMAYAPQHVAALYRALQAVAGEEAQTLDGQARLVRNFERALLGEGMVVVADLPPAVLDAARRQMPDDN